MSEGAKKESQKETAQAGLTPVYPPETLPMAFADGVMNLHYSAEVVKFYLYRLDPDIVATNTRRETPVAQIAMPLTGFLFTALFFERMLKSFVKGGMVDEAHLAEMRQIAEAEDDGSDASTE